MPTITASDFATQLDEEAHKTIEFLQNLPEDVWENQIYTDGPAWTVRQIGIHLVESEKSLPRLISNVLAGGEGVSEEFDLDRYNKSKVSKMDGLTRDEIIAQFSELRAETIKMVAKLKEDDLEVVGRHPFAGETTVRGMLRLMIMNVKGHLRDIRRVLGEKG